MDGAAAPVPLQDKSTTDSPHSSGFHAFDLSPDTASQRVPKHSPKRGPFFTRASLSKRGSVPGTPGRWNPITAISWGRAKAREEDFSAVLFGLLCNRVYTPPPPLLSRQRLCPRNTGRWFRQFLHR